MSVKPLPLKHQIHFEKHKHKLAVFFNKNSIIRVSTHRAIALQQ
jgi:hypothetical protein